MPTDAGAICVYLTIYEKILLEFITEDNSNNTF